MLKFFCSRQRKIKLGSLYNEINCQLLEGICKMDTLYVSGISGDIYTYTGSSGYSELSSP